ncbi:hypothetical protein SAMN05660831_02324 [Thiohalospira halophila DSM 15071]|uniref:Uncharacterized protein n=1 Tax=Thiohalospira halophila DSM 15071 TaxID=1123397 RepID=A0A1I1VAS5_9GAMM|nr:hypothetical protein [Thiohalospira halophila]SFD80191.1 hypothetical protein SAMN05660831_02324 [Thiohalospira halophila DSM 15071]
MTPEPQKQRNFVLGNALLALAALAIFFFGPLWERFGIGALVGWMVLAAVGVYLVTRDRDTPGGP